MEEILKALVDQAFKSQNERIEALKKDIEQLKADKNAQAEEVKDLKELNNLFDKRLTEISDYISAYVVKEEDALALEDFKYGE